MHLLVFFHVLNFAPLQNFGSDTELSAKPPVHATVGVAHGMAFISLGQETFKCFFRYAGKQTRDEKDLLWLLMAWLSAEV